MNDNELESPEDLELAQALEGYLEAREAGRYMDVARLAGEHPRVAGRLRACLASLEAVEAVGSPLPEGEPREPGCLRDYRILREVGRGGMGVVYEAEQISLRRRVALKVLPFAATIDPRRLQRFHNEAYAAASLHHEHIVPVHAVGCERGLHFYAMQFVDGCTLAEVIAARRGKGDPDREAAPSAETAAALSTVEQRKGGGYYREAARIGIEAALALEHAHSLGVVHRDVKPANLMIDGRGKLWVTDFGLARLSDESGVTASGDLLGTMRYMSPEQALSRHGLVDHRTDVYSLGATLYELLTLRPAVDGRDRQEVLRQVAFEEPLAPRRVNKSVPAELETIVLKAMEKDPADRYATAQGLADDLSRYLRNEPIGARPSSLAQRARKVARRHPGVTVTAAVALVAGLLLVVAGLALNNRIVRQEELRTRDALTRAEREKAIAQAVRAFLRDKLLIQADPRARADALRRAGGRPAAPRPNPTVRELLDRAAAELVPDRIEGLFPDQPLVQAELLKTVGEAYNGIGDHGPAIRHLERAGELQTRELSSRHPDTLATTHSLARVYLNDGKVEEAARLFERVRDLRGQTLGPGHPDTLASTSDLVRCYFRLNRHEEALSLREEIATAREASLGGEHPATLESRSHLANSYAAVRRPGAALRLHQEAMATRQRTLGEDHPDTLQSLNNVANCQAALGRYAEALKLHRQALERRRAALGPDHPDTLQSMNNVGVACSALGRHAEALRLFQETLALRKAKLLDRHPDTVQSMNALAWMLANCPDGALRDTGQALAFAKQVVQLSPDKGTHWNTLGAACYRVGDWNGAVGALTKSMGLCKGGDGLDWVFLAMAHWRLGDRGQARRWYGRAVEWMDTQPEDEELRSFRAEAEDLLEIERP
ncbi:MAG: serine/threonine-protein kinase [Gemmataceae bacterium]